MFYLFIYLLIILKRYCIVPIDIKLQFNYRIEASPSLRLVNMDVTNEDHVRHALDYVAENLPAGQQGRNQSTMH